MVLVSFRALQFNLSRRILSAWVRPTILGANAETLELQSDDLICYVLRSRSIADLLISDIACERGDLPAAVTPIPGIDEKRAFFFLGHPEGTPGRNTLREQSTRMTRLFEHQTTEPQSIKIIPISLFLGHQPDREKSLFKLLLSENWSATSGLKKFFAMLFHPGHILVQFGTPIRLDELMATEKERPRQIRKLLRLLRVHFNNQRLAIIGPDLSHRRTLLNTILESTEVRAAIDKEARSGTDSYQKIEKKARSYAKEIASDQSYRVIRFFDVILTWLWNRLYGGVEVNGVETVKQLAQSHEIVYTPCHRSHIDYLLLSYVLYHNGLTPPHIAAGKNLNLPLIGPLLRRAGAFFMRRTFQGDALYKEIFDEYLHQMFTRGFSVEYFIEGSRSRTGRTLSPKTGMLRMTVRSFLKDSSKPIAFLPVYFGYERVLESSTYTAELSGRDKKSESVFDVFKIFSSFRRDFGQVTVNFGEPILLQEFLDETQPQWAQEAEQAPAKFNKTCDELALRLVTRINTAVAIKASNLVAVALLSTTRQNIEEHHLLNQIELLRQIAIRCAHTGCSIVDTSSAEILDDAIAIAGLSRTEHQFGTIISASPARLINLTYSANNVIHIYTLPSLVARFVRARNQTTQAQLLAFITELFPFLKAEMFLPWDAQDLPEIIDAVVNCMADLDLIIKTGDTLLTPSPESPEYSGLQDITRISDPTLERFYIVMALLQNSAPPSLKMLETAASGIARQLSVLYGINSPEFFERSLFSTFLNTLKTQEVVDSNLNHLERFSQLENCTAQTIDSDVRYNILQAVSNYDQAQRTKTS